MQIEESRRLTGPNLFTTAPGAICDVIVDSERRAAMIAAWHAQARLLLDAVGWHNSQCFDRSHATGASLVLTAPIDCLYAATDLNEAAFERAQCVVDGGAMPDISASIAALETLIANERNPALLALHREAEQRNVPFLVDDDDVSLGYGANATVWPTAAPPDPQQVDWQGAGQHGDVPVALITGTNGKSTTVRLAAAIIAANKRIAGITSTDYIRVGDDVVDSGDYSGPGGARQLLRHPQTEVALLEVARGGMLRRGLGVTNADVALITNVAADHLGEYGIHTVAQLRDAKFVVKQGLAAGRPLLLNADDAGIVAYAAQLPDQRFVWFSEYAQDPLIAAHTAAGGDAFVVDAGQLCRVVAGNKHTIVDVRDVPVTLAGAARHNVQNALAAAALCHALGCDDVAIREGLLAFGGGPEENPGRGNLFSGNGLQVVVDFAHNEHGLSAMAQTIAQMPAKRRLVLMGQAGDRSNALIEGLTHAALQARPDALVICQLPGYERGRPADEVPQLIQQCALQAGVDAQSIHLAQSPSSGTRYALDWAQPGDVLLILALSERAQCIELIERALG